MKKQITEEKLLKQLDIPDWRHMSKDKIVEFTSNLQYLDPEVAMAAINQFPKFADMSTEIVKRLSDSLKDVCASEDKATAEAYEINAKLLDNLEKRLNKRFLLPGERKKIIEAMVQVSNNIAEIHKNHTTGIFGGFKQVTGAAIAVIGTAGVVLGATLRKKL